MANIMIDLETMGTSSNAAIIAIGACKFGSKGVTDKFYEVVDLGNAVKWGMTMDTSTVLWWMQQSEEARGEFARKGISLPAALEAFAGWIEKDDKIWGNGSDFDNVILANAYRLCGQELPWKFWNNRCYRTLKGLFTKIEAGDRAGTHHNALDDAIFQAEHTIRIMGSLTKAM